MHPLDLDIMEVKELFDEVELELEDEALGETTFNSWSNQSEIAVRSYISGDLVEDEQSNRSIDISSVVAKEASKLHDRSEQSLLEILPEADRTVRLPPQLLEGVPIDKLTFQIKLEQEEGVQCLKGDNSHINRQLDIIAKLIVESYK